MNKMDKERKIDKVKNWIGRLRKSEPKEVNVREKSHKVLTMDNTVATKLTHFDPHMMVPASQTQVEDWQVDVVTGLLNREVDE